jgi:hypothetical protein
MNKVVVTDEVFFINDIYLTKDAIEIISVLQDIEKPVNNPEEDWPDQDLCNKVLNEKIARLDNMVHEFIFLAEGNLMQISEAWKFISWLNDIRYYFSALKIPPKPEKSV